jgi:hypothetical protein
MRYPIQDDAVKKLDDFAMPLYQLKRIVDTLIEKHGEDVMLACDGGHNNVQFELYHVISPEEINKLISDRRKKGVPDVHTEAPKPRKEKLKKPKLKTC